MEERKMTLAEENIMLHKQSQRLDIVREYVVSELLHNSYPKLDRTLCLLLQLDYDEIMAERED